MNSRLFSQTKILAGLLSILALFLLVVLASGSRGTLVGFATAQTEQPVSVQDQLQRVDQLIQRYESITLDAAFLASPGFRSLRDFSITLPRPREVGRDNPFMPLPEMQDMEADADENSAAAGSSESPGFSMPAPMSIQTIVPTE